MIQVFLSGIAAWLVCFALYELFDTRFSISAAGALLCSIEPLQLLMERYVMTETLANFLFAIQFVLATAYVKRGKLWMLVLAQVAGVLLITIRLSFLAEVLLLSILLPFLSPQVRQIFNRERWKTCMRTAGLALALSLLVSQGLITAYEHWYGHLEHGKPALMYESGAFLISDFYPIVEPQDFPAADKRAEVFGRVTLDRSQLWLRTAEHFAPEGIVHSINTSFPDPAQADELEKATVIHAVLRDPLAAVKLAFQTFGQYFDSHTLRGMLPVEEGFGQHMSPVVRSWLVDYYSVRNPHDAEPALTKTWYSHAIPWYRFILCVLVISPLVLFLSRGDWPALLLCVLLAWLFLEGATVPVEAPTARYLLSAAWLVLLLLGITVDRVIPKRSL